VFERIDDLVRVQQMLNDPESKLYKCPSERLNGVELAVPELAIPILEECGVAALFRVLEKAVI
jgi:hypothetical protein